MCQTLPPRLMMLGMKKERRKWSGYGRLTLHDKLLMVHVLCMYMALWIAK